MSGAVDGRGCFRQGAAEADVSAKAPHERSTLDLHRLALVAMLEQVMSVEEWEALAYAHNHRLHRLADGQTATRAIVNHVDREIARHLDTMRKDHDPATHRVLSGRVALMREVRALWIDRHPIPDLINRSNAP